MNIPLVTLCTSIYNHEKYLDAYFKSVVNQTYKNIQLILIDDFSTDNSKKVVEKWLSRLRDRFDNFIYIIQTENKGVIENCNLGLSMAEGKYFYLFASDDIMLPRNIEEKVNFLENNPKYAMVYSDCYLIDEKFSYEENLNRYKKSSNIQKLFEGNVFTKLLMHGCFIPAPTVLMKKEIVQNQEGYSEEYIFEDYYMWLKIAQNYKIGLINSPLVCYRIVPNSISHKKESYIKLQYDHERLLFEYINNNIGKFYAEKGLENLYENACKGFYTLDDYQEFLLFYKKLSKKTIRLKIMRTLFLLNIKYKHLRKIKQIFKVKKIIKVH